MWVDELREDILLMAHQLGCCIRCCVRMCGINPLISDAYGAPDPFINGLIVNKFPNFPLMPISSLCGACNGLLQYIFPDDYKSESWNISQLQLLNQSRNEGGSPFVSTNCSIAINIPPWIQITQQMMQSLIKSKNITIYRTPSEVKEVYKPILQKQFGEFLNCAYDFESTVKVGFLMLDRFDFYHFIGFCGTLSAIIHSTRDATSFI